MPNKQLTATVRLNTTQAEQSINRLVRKINTINNALNNTTNNRTEEQLNRSNTKLREIVSKVKSWANNQKSVNSGLRSSNSLLKSVGSKVKSIAATYLGIMGTKALINTTDTITSAENKLNYVNAQNLGGSGVNSNGSYSPATFKATQDAMDKMYASSQKVRMGYDDMMSNVSKSMALAGDAFQNNTDNAIRFQEIMAEAYAVGGASAQEMSTSMYQMIQALGAGTLAGDELRSVREGAPLAYKAIEDFVQGVYNSEESLKDLASQGKVTSDMVVAAIMNASSEMDSAFAQTEQTFAQTWNQIKNAAIYAFKPVANSLREALNNAIDNGLLTKIETLFVNVSKVLQIIFKVISNAISWIADNWSWLKNWIIAGLILIGTYFVVTQTIAIASAIKSAVAWAIVHWQLLLIVVAIAGIIFAFYKLQQGALTTTQFLVICATIISAAFLIAGIMMCSVPMMVIGAILALLTVCFMFFEQVCGGAWVAVTFIVNLIQSLLNIIITIILLILTTIYNAFAFIVNLTVGLSNVIGSICENIGIAFQNAWIWAKNTFWEFLADVLDGLSKLEPVINGIAGLLGKSGVDFGGLSAGLRSNKQEYKDYVSIGDAWSNGWNSVDFIDYGNVIDIGSSAVGTGLSDWSLKDAYNTGANWGTAIKDSINNWGSGKLDKLGEFGDKFSLDNIGKSLGLNFGYLTGANGGGFPNANDPAYDLTGAYNQPSNDDLLKGVKGTEDNTGRMADAMELSQEDLEYLRKIAEMEWKKEYTTANITVDMSNYNTINSENDLDGIVTKLTDKLYEEMNSLANGVYA